MVRPVSVTATGLAPGQVYAISLTSTDSRGVHWASSARFRSTDTGTVAMDRAKALGGSYSGVNGMGLMESLQPQDAPAAAAYFWSGSPRQFRIQVTRDDKAVAETVFRRQLGPGVQRTRQAVGQEGFDGAFYRDDASGTVAPRPAILAFGGSEGGNAMTLPGMTLAASGYPTLTVAYFHAPGLPQNLVKIPLEYFATALRWLRSQPGVDPSRIYILGVSRGSEAAQLVAVHYPELVHGVILAVPSGVVHQGLAGTGVAARPAGVSAWSFQGKAIPYARSVNQPHPTQVPGSVIPDEEIRGPIFLVCGGHDQIWDSCPFARAITARLQHQQVPYRHVLADYPAAGHGVGTLAPYEPTATSLVGPLAGSSPWSNQQARAGAWPRLISFLQATATHPR